MEHTQPDYDGLAKLILETLGEKETERRLFKMDVAKLSEHLEPLVEKPENMFGYSSSINWDQFTDTERELLESLPHGSGVNCDWHIDRNTSGKIVCSNSFQVMSEYGYYVGYADFSVRFSPDAPQDFRLMFHGSTAQYLARYYMLRDYLEDTIAYSLTA